MQFDKSLFSNYHRLRHRLYVGGIGSGLKAVRISEVKITDPNGVSRILKGVLHVSKLTCRLISLNTLALDDINSIITKQGCTVSDGVFKIHSPIKNGLCISSQDEYKSDLESGGATALFAAIPPKRLPSQTCMSTSAITARIRCSNTVKMLLPTWKSTQWKGRTKCTRFHANHTSSASIHGASFPLAAASGPSPSNWCIRVLWSLTSLPSAMGNTPSHSSMMQAIMHPFS
jgi:hypothetical protein